MEAFQAAGEANGKEKECDPICKREKDEQDGLGRNPGEDDFRWEHSDRNITKVVIR